MKPSVIHAAHHPFLSQSSLFADGGPEGGAVADLASVRFEAYAKILSPLYAFDPVPQAWESLTWTDLGAGHFPGMEDYPDMLDSHVNYMVAPSGEKRISLRRVSWKEAYASVGLKWDATASIEELLLALESRSLPAELFGPDEGHLDPRVLEVLLPLLTAHSGFASGLFHYDALRRDEDAAEDTPDLFKGTLQELARHQAPEGFVQATPCAFWPEDGAWFVHCDYDLTFAVVGGTKALVKALVAESRLDAVVVSGDAPLVTLRGNPDKAGLLYQEFPSPHGVGPLDPVKWKQALARG